MSDSDVFELRSEACPEFPSRRQAERELVVTVGPALHEGCAARLDLLEVFGQTREEFGWKERVEAAEATEVEVSGFRRLRAGRV